MASKAKKVTNRSIVSSAKPKALRTFQEERDARLGLRLLPIDDEYLMQLGDELVEWTKSRMKTGKYVSLGRFYEEKNIYNQTVVNWRKRSPYLDSCVKEAQRIMGNNIEEGLLNKQFSEKASMYMLHHYLPEWDQANKYHDDRKKVTDTIAALLGKTFNVGQLDESERDDEVDKDTK